MYVYIIYTYWYVYTIISNVYVYIHILVCKNIFIRTYIVFGICIYAYSCMYINMDTNALYINIYTHWNWTHVVYLIKI